MKYYSAIISFFLLSVITLIGLLYFANLSKNIQIVNNYFIKQINFIEDQININEIEYSLYSGYEYLEKMKKIYFLNSESQKSIKSNTRISYSDFKNKNIENFYTVGIK